jgi:hypothetical protein
MLSSLLDGLEVLDPLQSCDKQAGESSSRCFYKAKVYTVCYSTIYPVVSKSTYLSSLALRGKLGDSFPLCRGNAEVWERTIQRWLKGVARRSMR